MSNDMDLRTSYKKFIQDLPQLLADRGPEQVYALYKAENYGSLRAGGFREEIERMASPAPHWCDQGFFRLAELYDGLQRAAVAPIHRRWNPRKVVHDGR